MSTMLELERFRVVPVVVLDNASYATSLGDALVAGGLACAEITLRTAGSLDVVATLAARGDMLIGAGTVLDVDQVDRAVDAGAQFLVSPGLDRDVVERAHSQGVMVLPGVATATEVQAARRMGLERVKFFPATAAGGVPLLAALHGPYPLVRFMPTGGITLSSLEDYLSHPAVFAVGGSWMVPRAALDGGAFDDVERLTRETVTRLAGLTAR